MSRARSGFDSILARDHVTKQRSIRLHSHIVTNGDQIGFVDASSVEYNIFANLCPKGPVPRVEQAGAAKRIEQEEVGEGHESVDEPPSQVHRAIDRVGTSAVSANDRPLDGPHHEQLEHE